MGSEDGKRHRLVLSLNQQQIELVDRTIANGFAESREALFRLALKEYDERRGAKADA
ncbi:hypothetical protein LP7551_01851 [Roseibium album]|nr:hypothetical protein LP7551_01851 [Roseibium album]